MPSKTKRELVPDNCAVHQTGDRFQARHRLLFTGIQSDGCAGLWLPSSESEVGNGRW